MENRLEEEKSMKADIKEQLHRFVNELPDSELRAAERFLEYLRNVGSDPLFRKLMTAPLDDEPETPEEAEAVQEAREALARGEVLTDEQLRRGPGR
jgi:hypothetical protein